MGRERTDLQDDIRWDRQVDDAVRLALTRGRPPHRAELELDILRTDNGAQGEREEGEVSAAHS